MAGKPLNRLELRRQSDAAEPLDPMEDESEDVAEDLDDDDGEKKPKKKPKAAAKAKVKAVKAVKAVKPATRMRIVWTVMNDAFKAVGTFEYAQKEAAEARAAELMAKGKGTHFVMKTKEPMPDNAPGLGAAIPRSEVAPPEAEVKEAAAAATDEDDDADTDAEDDDEAEADDEPDEE